MLWYLENSQHVDVHDVYNFETVLQVLLRQQLEHDDAYKEQRALLPRVVGELLQLGADPNRQDKFKRTPLWMAVLANEEDVIDSMVVHAQKAVEDHYRAGNSDILRRIANPTWSLHGFKEVQGMASLLKTTPSMMMRKSTNHHGISLSTRS